eukprot:366510-Chlamydomonas_euryale.AAC.25
MRPAPDCLKKRGHGLASGTAPVTVPLLPRGALAAHAPRRPRSTPHCGPARMHGAHAHRTGG